MRECLHLRVKESIFCFGGEARSGHLLAAQGTDDGSPEQLTDTRTTVDYVKLKGTIFDVCVRVYLMTLEITPIVTS